MRRLARAALEAYGLGDADLRFLRQAGNTLFRVNEPAKAQPGPRGGLFVEGQYLLRVHQPGYQKPDGIRLELEWLAAMRRDAGEPVQEPVQTRDGRLVVAIEAPGVPEARYCSLLRWLQGRYIRKNVRPRHIRAQGRLMARLHAHASTYEVPQGLTKKCYDWDGLFKDDDGTGLPASEAWKLLPSSSVEPFKAVAREVRQVMNAWGKDPGVYGLIHGDLGVDANVLFRGGEARAIDFDDSGFGYYVYDLAIALEHCQDDAGYSDYRRALLYGYREARSLAEEHAGRLELFQAAFHVYWSLWAAAIVHLHPEYGEGLRKRSARAATLVKRYLSGN
jgi:Ser/Thr protein kinase RdoA (MazF antagonist)